LPDPTGWAGRRRGERAGDASRRFGTCPFPKTSALLVHRQHDNAGLRRPWSLVGEIFVPQGCRGERYAGYVDPARGPIGGPQRGLPIVNRRPACRAPLRDGADATK